MSRNYWYFINDNNFYLLITSSAQFLLINGINFPRQGMFKPKCIVSPVILIAATPAGASTRTLGLSGFPPSYKNDLLIK